MTEPFPHAHTTMRRIKVLLDKTRPDWEPIPPAVAELMDLFLVEMIWEAQATVGQLKHQSAMDPTGFVEKTRQYYAHGAAFLKHCRHRLSHLTKAPTRKRKAR